MEKGDEVREVARWLIIAAATLLVIGLIAYARGPKHHHGRNVGALHASISQVGAT
jgi:hypothetical protein